MINELFSEATTIHWHGVHMPGTPYMDGARSVTQGPIGPGENFTYRFQAWPPGTHYYHSHMDAVQGARGLKGPLVIERAEDPYRGMYDEDQVAALALDGPGALRRQRSSPFLALPPLPTNCLHLCLQVIFLSDEWRDPSVCLKIEGAMPGNDVCADIRHGSFNGQFGNGSSQFPFPLVSVEEGKCYRLRMILAGSNTENFVVAIAG